jgi:glycosyltransferase involved in cell wall biosynthesis/2-polyprenyl-3-methyl-5-hydroxy-6-metoxy-1,4-benzoquinol methylase
MDYQREYDEYWARPDRWGSHSFSDPERIADQVISLCGMGQMLDVGFGMGLLVRTLLKRGVDAHGLDVAERVVREAEQLVPGRFKQGSILAVPCPNGAFRTVVSTDCLEHLAEEDVPAALLELYRVAQRFVFIQLATTPDRDRRWHLTIRDRAWWETRFFEAGFRKHPLIQTVVPYESLEKDGRQITLVFERIPAAARERHPLAALAAERDLHMDMLRETGRRSDAHIARYTLAREHLPAEGLVLDTACGLGYGTAILGLGSRPETFGPHSAPGVRILGIDSSAFAIEYARSHFSPGLANVEFREGDVCRLAGVEDHSVEMVVSFETIEHLKEPERFLLEVQRVLKPGGLFLGSFPNMWVNETGRDPNPWHYHVFDLAKLAALCSQFLELRQVCRQNAGGGMKLPQSHRQLRRLNLPVTSGLDDAEWWIVGATKEQAAPVWLTSPAQARRLVLLTADPNHPMYSSWLPHWKLPFQVLKPANVGDQLLKDAAMVVTHDTYVEPGRSLIRKAVRAGIPTLILADGILEYRNIWEHPQLRPGAVFQPVLGHKIACLGRSQARYLESWGNAGKCEVTGSPRFDRYYGLRRRQKPLEEPFQILVMTALTPCFDERQHRLVLTALRHVKEFFAEQQTIGEFGLKPVWRLTQGLALELDVASTANDLTGRELAEVLQTVDAVVTTPSTAMLEAMMLGLPVAVLDYTNSPLYVHPAWHITAQQQVPAVIAELLQPPAPKMLFQETTLHDCLQCSTPAAPRLIRILMEMMDCRRRAEESGKPLLFPDRILEDALAGPSQQENRFELETLYPSPTPSASPPADLSVRARRGTWPHPRIFELRGKRQREIAPPNAPLAHGVADCSSRQTADPTGIEELNRQNGGAARPARKGKLLFVVHEASRTGAPLFLLNLIRWARDHDKSAFRILLRSGGPLEDRFRELGETHIVSHLEATSPLLADVSLVYSNTAANGMFLRNLASTSIPIVTHVHELEPTLESFGADNFEEVKRHTGHFIACSQAVSACLQQRHAISPAKITMVHEGIPIQSVVQRAAERTPAELKRWCGLADDAAVIAACGFADWRKGPDLFLQLADSLRRELSGRKELACVWIGRLPEDERGRMLLHDLRQLGLAESVKFIGEQENPYPWLALCDVFCLCSREDPFPLVMLEAAALSKPTVCFENAGGAEEFCARGGGFAGPYLDVAAMCERITQLLENEPLRRQAGKTAAQLVKNEFELGVIAPRILQVIEPFRREPSPPPPPLPPTIGRRLRKLGESVMGRFTAV